MIGKFITFEGIDGSGKTTQINMLEKQLIKEEIPYTILREPGGTKLSEKIMEILLDKKNINLSSTAESLLFVAARSQLMVEKIKPALEKDQFVICDRFVDSTIAYQGYGRGLDIQYLEQLNSFGTDGIFPDLTIILDVEPTIADQRIQNSNADRIESIGNNFFVRVQNGYHKIADLYSNRCVIIDGNQSAVNVFDAVYIEINERILKGMTCN